MSRNTPRSRNTLLAYLLDSQVAVLFTRDVQTARADLPLDQQTEEWESPKVVAERLRSRGIRIIAVGCCNANEAELRDIAGGSQYTVMAGSFQELGNKVDQVFRAAISGRNESCANLFVLDPLPLFVRCK